MKPLRLVWQCICTILCAELFGVQAIHHAIHTSKKRRMKESFFDFRSNQMVFLFINLFIYINGWIRGGTFHHWNVYGTINLYSSLVEDNSNTVFFFFWKMQAQSPTILMWIAFIASAELHGKFVIFCLLNNKAIQRSKRVTSIMSMTARLTFFILSNIILT